MRNVFGFVVASTLALAAPLAAQGGPVALVVRVQGEVRIERAGGPAAGAAAGDELRAGDVVAPAPGSRAILITRGGTQQVVTERTVVEEPRGGASSDLFARAVSTLARAAAVDATTGGRQGMVRPVPGQTALIAPRNALAVATRRPTFVWTATPGQRYDIMLRRSDGGRPVVYEAGTDTTWTLPADAPDLEAGARYQWTVFVGGRERGRAVTGTEFRVIGLEEAVELEDYLDEIAVFGLDPRGDGLLLTLVAYRDMGLFYEARRALEAVEASGPLSWQLYKLKGEILAELGHEDEARAAFDRADALAR